MEDLCELVTVSTESERRRGINSSLGHWETGKADVQALMYEPGDLPSAGTGNLDLIMIRDPGSRVIGCTICRKI